VGDETAGPEERARLWAQVPKMYSLCDEYQTKTSREIPVVILTPSATGEF
jgi:F420H(2)-dependent quinone reductase